MSKITVNDEVQEPNLPISVSELLKQNNVQQPEMVSVQINGDFVAREHFETTTVNDGDVVDFLYFMGGGQWISQKNK